MINRQPAVKLEHHGLALAVLLLGLLPLVGTDAVWSADVGAQLYQSAHLLEGTGWTTFHPFPEVDPDGRLYAIHLAQRPTPALGNPHQYVALAKHPFLTWVVAGLVSIGGFTAVVAVSALGTAAAAMAAGRTTELFQPALGPWALWLTGVFSPLFFDAYIGYAHTLAAAFIGWSMYWALRSINAEHPLPAQMAAGALAGAACLARTEGALAAVALAAGVAALALVEPPKRSSTSSAGTVAGLRALFLRRPIRTAMWISGGTVVAVAVDQAAAFPTSGPANPEWRPDSPSFLIGRWLGFTQTWLNPGRSTEDLLIVIIVLVLVVGAFVVLRTADTADSKSGGRTDGVGRLTLAAAAVAVVAVAIRAFMPAPVVVSGMLFAFPALAVGLLALRRRHLRATPVLVASIGFGLYVLAVAATQYPYGGVAEWGGRYFAAGLPLAAVLIVEPLYNCSQLLPDHTRSSTVALFAAACIGLNTLGLRSLHDVRQSTSELVDEIAAATDNGDDQSLVVTTVPLAGRVSWSIFDDARWLLVDGDELDELGVNLRHMQVDNFTLVTFNPQADTSLLTNSYRPRDPEAPGSRLGADDDTKLVPDEAVILMTATGDNR